MLYQSQQMEEQAALQTAAQMCAAARTAPLDEIAENLAIIGKVKIHVTAGQMTID